jgi:hypothetical protein
MNGKREGGIETVITGESRALGNQETPVRGPLKTFLEK